MPIRWLVWSAALVAGIGAGIGIAAANQTPSQAAVPSIPTAPQAPNPRVDPGTRLSSAAPAFTLTDQFGRDVSLSSFRGKVVVVSFNDPRCTTICPLTTTALLEAKKLLGPAAADVQLLGIGANPEATQVKWVRDYSKAHGMLHKWLFLTSSLPRLKRVWASYGVGAAVVAGAIDHTPATFVVDPNGRETRLFLTEMSYSSVPQLAEVLARGIAAALPGKPPVSNAVSLARIPPIGPRRRIRIPLATLHSTGSIPLGPGDGPHLLVFFDSWDPGIAADLRRLNEYPDSNAGAPLIAIDELNVEPSVKAFRTFRRGLDLEYWVAMDRDGRIADGYGVQDSPWLTLVSGTGQILWRYDVAAKGWPRTAWLISRVRAALARAQA